AVENGSRAWRMDSLDSDYDVRFVFVRLLKDYIQIRKLSEVITKSFNKDGNPCSPKGAVIDIAGFDIFKYVKLLSASNPTAIEWLMSDIVYFGEQNNSFKKWIIKHVDSMALYHHYKSMCRYNYFQYIKSGKNITYKKYLYAYRGLINAKWVVHKKSIPPIIFAEAIKEMNKILPNSILNRLYEIIDLKSDGKETDIIKNITEMDSYVEEFLKDDSEAPLGNKKAHTPDLDHELRKIVLGV
ncbi:nucleotidyltransferase domain-containing protein, partial [Candidatus Woesearchaeota archaeon]|nr:nucleotidyltransferase domain-containing protein [Candidatus Woesearchaeota archaeon]